MKNAHFIDNCNPVLVGLFILGILLSINVEINSQQLSSIPQVGVPIRQEIVQMPCDPECRKIKRMDYDTSYVKGQKLVYKKDELMVSFPDGKLSCQRLVKLTGASPMIRDSFYQILINNKINIKDASLVEVEIRDLCLKKQNDILSKLKVFYVKTIFNTIESKNIKPGENPEKTKVQKCLCDKDIFIIQAGGIHSENFVNAAQESEELGSEGGSISRNLIIESDKNTMAVRSIYETPKIEDSTAVYSGKVVAFLDSGLDLNHFRQNLLIEKGQDLCLGDDYFGWNFIDNNGDTKDYFGHGTLVTASFDFVLRNFTSTWNYKILPVKVLDDCGQGTLYSVTCGLYYAKAKGADIVNTSWGLYHHRDQLEDAVMDLANDNIYIVTSAGNQGKKLDTVNHFPSGYSENSYTMTDTFQTHTNVFSVSGLNQDYYISGRCFIDLWGGSNFGADNIVENATGYEGLMLSQPYSQMLAADTESCACDGTSYAAPRFTAALITTPLFNNNDNDVNERLITDYRLRSYWTEFNDCILMNVELPTIILD